jgi:hypothetical protein
MTDAAAPRDDREHHRKQAATEIRESLRHQREPDVSVTAALRGLTHALLALGEFPVPQSMLGARSPMDPHELRDWLLKWPDGTGFQCSKASKPRLLWQLFRDEQRDPEDPEAKEPAMVNTFNGRRFWLDADGEDILSVAAFGPYTVVSLGSQEEA